MADDSALRSSLEELKNMQEGELAETTPTPSDPSPVKPTGRSSLLDDLLAETQVQARKEMDEVKAALRNKHEAEDAARRQEQEERRRHLDDLRRQESERRAEMIRERQRRVDSSQRPVDVAPEVEASEPIPEKSNMNMFVGVLTVTLLAAGGFWYLQNQRAEDALVEQQATATTKASEEQKWAKDVAAAKKKQSIKDHAAWQANLKQVSKFYRTTDNKELRRPRNLEVGLLAPELPAASKRVKRRGKRRASARKARRGKKKRKGGIQIRKLKLNRM